MKHLHIRSGQTFEVGEYRDGDKTYDITVISYWKDPETQDVGSPVEIIGYYFGGYDKDATNLYIDRWIANRNKEISTLQTARKYVRDYLIINRDVIDESTLNELDQTIAHCDELLRDRSWHLEDKLPPAFKMNKYEYVRFIDTLLQIDEITEHGAQALLELQINFPEE